MSRHIPLTILAATLALLPRAAAAGDEEWLPADDDTVWTYSRNQPSGAFDARVRSRYRTWAKIEGFEGFLGSGDRWVDPSGDRVSIWSNLGPTVIDLRAPVGTTFETALGACNIGEATIVARGGRVVVPAGSFSDTVHLSLTTSCGSGGITGLWLARGVGIVRWTELGRDGTVTGELIELSHRWTVWSPSRVPAHQAPAAFVDYVRQNSPFWTPTMVFVEGASAVADAARDLGYSTQDVISAFERATVR